MKFLQSPNAVYLGLALGLVLLAPYAGCHLLLTEKPAASPDDARDPDRIKPQGEGQEKAGRPDSPSRERKRLSDIEDLLAK